MEKQDKKNKQSIRKKYIEEKEEFQEKRSDYKKILDGIYNFKKNNPKYYISNIIKILYNENFLINCYENISKNAGSLTKGTDQTTADKINLNRIKKLAESLKNDTFEFKPARRILIPKPGKSVMRPLTIPNFDDRIIQEGIRVILNTIYEPDFEKINCNYGFRPGKSTSDAIDFILTNGKTMNWAIEGDIEKAYDTVNIKKLISILEKKIKDKKFLKLIEQGLRNGIMFEKIYENTTLGIPQESSGIASPILFNIYMHEFDEFILKHLEDLKNNINTNQKRSGLNKDTRSKLYTRASNSKRKIVDQIKAFTAKMSKPIRNYNLQEKIKIRNLSKRNRKIKSKIILIKSTANHRKLIKFIYTRYADDWIILTNTTKEIVEQIKDSIKNWLKENLFLNLSIEKTKITNIEKEYFGFLGYKFRNNQSRAPLISFLKPSKNNRVIKQRASWGLYSTIDHERIINRLINKRFINQKKLPIHSTLYLLLKPHEIVYRFKMMIEGLFNYYYKHITFKSILHRYYYYLIYSCYKTLAAREKTSIRKIIVKYGKNPKVIYDDFYKDKNNNEIKKKRTQQILSYGETLKEIQKRYLKGLEKPNIDFLTIHVNLRTAYKFTKYCCICGTNPSNKNPIEAHHVNAIKKSGIEITGFTEIMKTLNKKQITICKQCHKNIHKGEYNGLKLSEFYDPVLAEI